PHRGRDIVGRSGLLGSVEDAEVPWSASLRDLGDPAAGGLVRIDPSVGTLAMPIRAVGAVLAWCCDSQIARAVVEAVAVGMIDEHARWGTRDFPVKVDSAALP